MNQVVLSSAARQVADVLREEILAALEHQAEFFLGSEEDLMSRLGVGRPTLRQAARVLEQEQMLAVKRGVGGGFFGRRPTSHVVTHTASLFLRSQGATYADLMRSQITISVACAELAAANPDVAERRRAATWYAERLPEGTDGISGPRFFSVCAGFHRLLAELTDNITFRLFVDVLLELARPVAIDSFHDRSTIVQTARNHARIGRAVLAGESDRAGELMRGGLENALTWTRASRPLDERTQPSTSTSVDGSHGRDT
ncbi:GntR family transcriptional regulator [Pseudonocardia sulfidoxydans NBRC 16205]|uniref:GntR family transcriptional regulator n=1 Tax=Pseudonocardia sulfidoxydans NBRC 16205 TaxID=1223511 RepID=A0A511D8W4_9PSEU|nr:FCD domain-containing protein [Pseudonocardia sulfidoxydans]GEL21231.1 GntR family transcriptional regulator [Pseudonocardia sulfidoxydans NBRC 16205]